MKRIAMIATLAFLGVGIALWVSQSYVATWEPRLRSQLESRVGAALGVRVKMDDISISFLHRIALKNVEIWDTRNSPETQIFRAKEVALTVSLIDLPSAVLHRNPLELIGLITVDSPWVALSPEWVDAHRRKNRPATPSTPLWFAVEWNQGTLQWKDPSAPHGEWTLYQSQGHVRIRGPHINASVHGSLEQAESVDVLVTTLGSRWSALGRLTGGDIPGVIALAQHFNPRPLLPERWKTQGKFNLDIKCSGRGPLQKSQGLARWVQEAHLTLPEAHLDLGSGDPPLELNGTINLRNGRVDMTAFSIKGEKTQLKLSGSALPFSTLPQIDLQAQGHVGSWPLENVHAQIRRTAMGWELTPTTLPLYDGTLTLKGTSIAGQLDLSLTGNEMSLPALASSHIKDGLKGRLNFSLSSRGPAESLHTLGSFWLNDFSWAHSPAESLRGNLDVLPTHFELQGTSEDEEVEMRAEGTRTATSINLQKFLLQQRDGSTLTARGTYAPSNRHLHLTMEAKNASLPAEVPGATASLLKGHADLTGTLDGSLPDFLFKGEAHSQDFQVSTSSPSLASATVRWTPQEFNADATIGKAPGPQGWMRFLIQKGRLSVQRFSLLTPKGKIDLKAEGSWDTPSEGRLPEKITYHGEGRLSSLKEGTLWNAPFVIKGQLHPNNKWEGTLAFDAPKTSVHGKDAESLVAELNWNATELRWDEIRWGRSLASTGALHFGEPQSSGPSVTRLSGQIKARDLDLARWQSMFWPDMKDPLRGTITGAFSLDGPLQDPHLEFSAKVQKASWRAFQFDSSLNGTWKKEGLDPLLIDGTIQSGGKFHFQGHVSSNDQTASGSLDLTQFNLKPVGESLSFPYPLEGTSNGTLSVSGPLDALHFAGHVESKSLVYGQPTQNPIQVESITMDMKLEPAPDASQATRLTVTQAILKTREEEIRLNPGSFIDFSGTKEARLQIGTEIRNLHLSVFTFFGGLDLNGTWQIRPQGFAWNGDIFTRSLYINDYQLEQGHVQAAYFNRLLSFERPSNGPSLVTGSVDFQKAPQITFKDFTITGKNREALRLSGTLGPQELNFTMEGQGLDIGTLGGLAGFPYSLEGNANVKIRGTGDLDHPNVQGTLDIQDGEVMGLAFKDGAAAFAWQGHRITFTRLQLSDPGRYTLTGAGVFPLTTKKGTAVQDKSINFSVRLTDSNLGLLQSLSKEVKHAEGSVQALLQIQGTLDEPVLRGSFRVKNGDVDGAHYFRHVQNFQFAADFEGNDLVISDFRGKSGKGEFSGGGHVLFAGFVPKFYDLHLDIPTSKGIEVTVPELAIPESPLAKKLHFLTIASQGDVRGKMTFRGPAENPVFFGKAFISNGHFTFPPSSKRPPPPGFLEWIRRVTWDTDLHLSDGAWFENELVEASLNGDLSIKGTSDKLKVEGGMDISEGRFSYLGVEFNVRQARYDIRSSDSDNGIVTIPYVRGIAESQVQTVDPATGQGVEDTITLTINYAPVNEIKPQLRSSLTPGLAQDKLLARVTQLEVENLTPQERNYLYQQQMVRLVDTSLATPLARNLLKRTGLVDELRVSRVINPASPAALPTDPNNPAASQQTTVTNLLAGTKYTLAKNVSNRMSLGYGLRFEEIQSFDVDNKLANKLDLRSDVELSYRLLNNLYLRGIFDLPTTTPGALPDRKVTLEPHWRFGWWGNTNKAKPKPTPAPPPGTNPDARTSQ